MLRSTGIEKAVKANHAAQRIRIRLVPISPRKPLGGFASCARRRGRITSSNRPEVRHQRLLVASLNTVVLDRERKTEGTGPRTLDNHPLRNSARASRMTS